MRSLRPVPAKPATVRDGPTGKTPPRQGRNLPRASAGSLWFAHGRRLRRGIGVRCRGCAIGGTDCRWCVLRRVRPRLVHAHRQEQPARKEKGGEAQKKSRDARTPTVLITIDV